MNADNTMVLNAGHLVEFDSPENLLRLENSVFESLGKI